MSAAEFYEAGLTLPPSVRKDVALRLLESIEVADQELTIEEWWPRLRAEAREWLMANNGDAVPAALVAEIEAAGGPAADDPWWSDQDGGPGRCLPDDAVDWIEETANA